MQSSNINDASGESVADRIGSIKDEQMREQLIKLYKNLSGKSDATGVLASSEFTEFCESDKKYREFVLGVLNFCDAKENCMMLIEKMNDPTRVTSFIAMDGKRSLSGGDKFSKVIDDMSSRCVEQLSYLVGVDPTKQQNSFSHQYTNPTEFMHAEMGFVERDINEHTNQVRDMSLYIMLSAASGVVNSYAKSVINVQDERSRTSFKGLMRQAAVEFVDSIIGVVQAVIRACGGDKQIRNEDMLKRVEQLKQLEEELNNTRLNLSDPSNQDNKSAEALESLSNKLADVARRLQQLDKRGIGDALGQLLYKAPLAACSRCLSYMFDGKQVSPKDLEKLSEGLSDISQRISQNLDKLNGSNDERATKYKVMLSELGAETIKKDGFATTLHKKCSEIKTGGRG